MTSHTDLYVHGHITLDTLERYIEIDLARRAPAGQPIPTAWLPIPECDHDLVDITPMGSPAPELFCIRCGSRNFA